MTAEVPLAARRHELVSIVASGLAQAGLGGSDTVVAAVSGGRDSLALLAAVATSHRREVLGGVVVAHVHHHQRPEADAEADHVQEVAERFELPFALVHLSPDSKATPADLRAMRYDALTDIARAYEAPAVVTGHQARDQLETILLALVRGAGPRGLAGMAPVRALDSSTNLVRPMLLASREQAAAMCGAAALAWCDDPSNDDPNTLRGALRQHVLGRLDAMRPGIELRVAASADLQVAAVEALAAAILQPQEGTWSRTALADMPSGLVRASLHGAAATLVGGDVCGGFSSQTLRDATAAIADGKMHVRRFEIGAGVAVEVDAHSVRVEHT